jgi:hypothetical protein
MVAMKEKLAGLNKNFLSLLAIGSLGFSLVGCVDKGGNYQENLEKLDPEIQEILEVDELTKLRQENCRTHWTPVEVEARGNYGLIGAIDQAYIDQPGTWPGATSHVLESYNKAQKLGEGSFCVWVPGFNYSEKLQGLSCGEGFYSGVPNYAPVCQE